MPTSKKEKYAEIVYNRYTKAKELCENVFSRVEVNRNLYKGVLNLDDTYEWDYSLVDQQVFPLIRNYIARSNPSMTKVRLEARKEEDFERRQVNQDFVNWEINELPLTSLLTRGFFSNYIAGKAYYKTGWKYDPRVVVENDEYSYQMRPLINRGDLEFIRFNNLLIPNRNIQDLQEQPYIIELMQLRIGDMIKDNETFGYEYWDKKFIAKLKKGGVSSKELDYEADFVKDTDTKDRMAFMAATFPAARMQTLEGDVIYIPLIKHDRQVLNLNMENEYWHGHYPYIDMTAFPEDDEFFSMSVVDAVGDTQIASTEVLNQTLTNIRQVNNNMWIAGTSAASTPDYMFQQRPSGIIRVPGDPNQIQPIRPIDSTRSMLAVGQELNTKFERTGGISSLYSSGSASTKAINQTARGAQIIDENIETNVKMILDLFGEQVLKKLGNHFIELNAQYVSEEQTFAVTGKKGVRELVTISPDEISANFDVYTMSEEMIKQTPASRQASLQNLITLINTEASRAGVQADITPLMEALIDSYPDMENIDDIIVSLDEKSQRDIAMMERGQEPEILLRDPHLELVMAASIRFEDFQTLYPPEIIQLFEKYTEKHLRYIQAEQEAKMMAQPQMPQAMSPEAMAQSAGAGTIPEATGTGQRSGYNLSQIK